MKKIKNEKRKNNIKRTVKRNLKSIKAGLITFGLTMVLCAGIITGTRSKYNEQVNEYKDSLSESLDLISEQQREIELLKNSNQSLQAEMDTIKEDNEILSSDLDDAIKVANGYNKVCSKVVNGDQVRIPVRESGTWYYYTGDDKQECSGNGVYNYLAGMQ